jgi:DNA-binding CsgD family transcriptional regulator/tetratricopeptide (TPR) repeat protein
VLALRALLPRTPGEGRRAALVSGEAGSGKSRLVRELARQLADEGAVVLYGACDSVVTPPYGPFAEALERLVRDADPEQLREDAGAGVGELTRILPALAGVFGELPPPVAAEADAERHRLHTAVTELLTAMGQRAPVLLVVEDVHWADLPTLLLVRHLVRAGAGARLLLVLTFRDTESDVPPSLAEMLVDVTRAEGVRRLRIGGLGSEDVAEFVRLASGHEAGRDVAEAMSTLTGGNAFLLTELWRELVEADALEINAATVRLARPVAAIGTPETVREVVAQRLARLGPDPALVLGLGATVGAEFDLDTVRRAAGLEEGGLLDAIHEAVRAGIIVEAPRRGLAYRFAHELVRRSVLDRVPAHQRAEMHAQVAKALESGSMFGDARARLAALAYHYAEAAPVLGPERAVSYNLLAAESATRALAFDDAAERLRTALALGVADPRERGETCLELGYACHRAGRSTDALDAFRETAEIARALDDAELLARAAIGFEEACWRPAIHDAGAGELLREAVAALGPEPTVTRVRLLGALTRALDFQGEATKAYGAREEATALARAIDDRRALGWVLASAYWAHTTRTHEEVSELLAEAVDIGTELDDPELLAEALWWQVPSFVALCDHSAARASLDQLFALAHMLHEPFRLHVAEHYASALALCDGDLVAAEAAALRSREWAQLLTGRDPSGVYGIQMFSLRREQGRLVELAPVVRLLAEGDRGSTWGPGLAAVLATLGMHDDARALLGRIRATGLEPVREGLWLGALTYLTDAASVVGDVETAALVLAALEDRRGSNVQIGHLVSCYGAADRYLGMLETVLGDWTAAEASFETAIALNRRLGARTWLAHTCVEYARMLLTRATGDDRMRAASLLREATNLVHEHGLSLVAAKVAELARTVDPTPGAPDGLTGREVDIIRLVAEGLSNREIGARLVISEHTAANHVRNILRKTGCANRTEAAAYAHRRGLVQS